MSCLRSLVPNGHQRIGANSHMPLLLARRSHEPSNVFLLNSRSVLTLQKPDIVRGGFTRLRSDHLFSQIENFVDFFIEHKPFQVDEHPESNYLFCSSHKQILHILDIATYYPHRPHLAKQISSCIDPLPIPPTNQHRGQVKR
jgi:hypothetical protein